MTVYLKDRVKQVTSTTGTGTITFSSTPSGYQSFSTAYNDGDEVYYVIENRSDYEIGIGTYIANTLSRDTVLKSTNGGAKLSLTGRSTVFVSVPAEKTVYIDGTGQASINLDKLSDVVIIAPASGQGVVYNGTNWVNGNISGYTDEQAQDAVAGMLIGSTGINIFYNDIANTLTIASTGLLRSSLNFSDLANVPIARTNLGLGTAALSNSGDFYLSTNPSGYISASSVAAGYQPLDGDLTSLAAATGVDTIYYRSATSTWSPVVIGTGILFSGGTLSNTLDLSSYATSTGVAALYTPLSRTITINGSGQDLTSNRSWTVGDLRSDSSYSDPTWLTTLAWSKISGTPTTISGYGITNAYTKTEVDSLVTGLLDFKGNLDCSANPNYPTGNKGDAYYVSVAGKIGGASGKSVDVGDMIIASADNAGGTEASVGTSWFVLEHNLVGALVASNNLSDLTSASTARSNLGLGSLATVTPTGTPNGSKFLRDDYSWQTIDLSPYLTTSSAATTYVPYTGATGAVNLGTQSLTAGTITANGQFTNTQGTLTSSAPLTLTQTWNSGATTFTGLRVNVTDTASASSSLLADFQIAGTSVCALSKGGSIDLPNDGWIGESSGSRVYFPNINNLVLVTANAGHLKCRSNVVGIAQSMPFVWGDNTDWTYSNGPITYDLALWRDSANTLAQRNGTNAQTFNIANTYTSTTSFEYGRFQWNTNEFRIGTAVGSAGGTQRNTIFGSWNSAGTWTAALAIGTNGRIGQSTVDGTYDAVFGLLTGNPLKLVGTLGGTFAFDLNTVDVYFKFANKNASFDNVNSYLFNQSAATSGTRKLATFTGAAHTGQTASTELVDFDVNLARTVTFAAGALTTQRAFRIQAPTYAFASASAITSASTLSISGAPIAGTNATITNAWALMIESGNLLLSNGAFSGAGIFFSNVGTLAPRIIATGSAGSNPLTYRAEFHEFRNEYNIFSMSTGGSSSYGTVLSSSFDLSFGTAPGTKTLSLWQDANDIFAQRRGINAQTFRLYNTFTSATNAEWYQESWVSNEIRLGTAVGSAGGTSRLLAVGYWNTAGTWKSLFTWDANDFVTFPVAITKHGTNTSTADAYIGNTQISQISDGAGYSIASNGYTAPGSTSPITGFTTRTGYGQSSRTASVFSAFHGTTDANSYWEWRRAAAASTSTTRIAYLDFGGNFTLSQQAAASGSPTAFTLTGAAHTTLTASTEATDVNVNLARTVQFATGALTIQRAFRIQAPTYAFPAASTITTAATLAVDTPQAGTNATISNAVSILSNSQLVQSFFAVGDPGFVKGFWMPLSGTISRLLIGSDEGTGGIEFMAGGGATGTYSSSTRGDIRLHRDAASTLGLKNGTNGMTFRVYNTFTSATSNEFITIGWATNVAQIGTVKGSAGGSARDLEFQTDGTTRFRIVNNVTAGRVLVMDANGNLSGSGYNLTVTGTFVGSMLASANSGVMSNSGNNSTVSVAGGSSISGAVGALLTLNGFGHASGGIFTLAGATPTTDSVTGTCAIKAVDAASAAVTNVTGGALTIGGGSAGGSNSAGGAVTIFGGQSRGTGLGGSIIFQTAAAGTTGSTLNSLTTRLTIDSTGLLTFAEGSNIAAGTTTGSKIGTSATQKLGFWNATPVVQNTGWSTSNSSSRKTIDATATNLNELIDLVCTLVETLKSYGIIGA